MKYACRECTGRPPGTVRPAATSACPATWPPNTRCTCSSGLRPRKMFTSIRSRLRRSRSLSSALAICPHIVTPRDHPVHVLLAHRTVDERLRCRSQPGDDNIKVTAPGAGRDGPSRLDDSPDGPHDDGQVGAGEVGADPAIFLGVGEQGID